MEKKINNALITGGCGFIGSNFCEHLIKSEIPVTVIDNYFTGSEDNHIDGATYIKSDTSNILDLKLDESFSHIFHFGEYSRVEQSFEDIDIVFKYNHNSIYPVLKFAKNKNAKFIYSGSSTKFGDSGENAYGSPYAFTKMINVEIIKTYAEWFDLDYAIAYFYNVYGEREISEGKYATLIAIYKKLYENNVEEFPVVLPGSQERNFTDVRDIVSALELIAVNGHGDGYGIGASESYKVIELVEMFGKKPEYLEERKGNRKIAPVLTELTKGLGWKQQFYLQDYINKIIS